MFSVFENLSLSLAKQASKNPVTNQSQKNRCTTRPISIDNSIESPKRSHPFADCRKHYRDDHLLQTEWNLENRRELDLECFLGKLCDSLTSESS